MSQSKLLYISVSLHHVCASSSGYGVGVYNYTCKTYDHKRKVCMEQYRFGGRSRCM